MNGFGFSSPDVSSVSLRFNGVPIGEVATLAMEGSTEEDPRVFFVAETIASGGDPTAGEGLVIDQAGIAAGRFGAGEAADVRELLPLAANARDSENRLRVVTWSSRTSHQ